VGVYGRHTVKIVGLVRFFVPAIEGFKFSVCIGTIGGKMIKQINLKVKNKTVCLKPASECPNTSQPNFFNYLKKNRTSYLTKTLLYHLLDREKRFKWRILAASGLRPISGQIGLETAFLPPECDFYSEGNDFYLRRQ
jgi:hypothetical protein